MSERPYNAPEYAIKCPKCGYWSGDAWAQCKRLCPHPGSPHHDDLTAYAFASFPDPSQTEEA